MSLARQVFAYSQWRGQICEALEAFGGWLRTQELDDALSGARLTGLLERLKEDRLYVAFVAEFSRGKSELINSILFAGYGERILPSAAGRTTMCPTELLHDPRKPPGLELLPIQTRREPVSLTEYRRRPGEWFRLPLAIESAHEVKKALRRVSEVLRVSAKEAEALGFPVGERDSALLPDETGQVEIPRWRHAIVNFPHPLLKEGLAILDTPGLNAIGVEPGLTLSLLPKAHVTLLVLAADTGVTRSDLSIWRQCIASAHRHERLVALNKIDSLWDDLRSAKEIEAEIAKQARVSARILDVREDRVFPVSAQKGLAAKIARNRELLVKSRLPALEQAISHRLVPVRQEIVRDGCQQEFTDLVGTLRDTLESRHASLGEQLCELDGLHGKNRNMMQFLMQKARQEKEDFEVSLQCYWNARNNFTRLQTRLANHLGARGLEDLSAEIRERMENAKFSAQLSEAMRAFFAQTRDKLSQADAEIQEIQSQAEILYNRFIMEYGVRLPRPRPFSFLSCERALAELEAWCETHIDNLANFFTREARFIRQRFFMEIVRQTSDIFRHARDTSEKWRKTIMAPVETHVREHRKHLKHRLENIRRILKAGSSLSEHAAELKERREAITQQLKTLETFQHKMERRLEKLPGQEAGPESKSAVVVA
ncbi:MAG: dynamin family protein [Zoogloeaceae bacterium]|jgi:GTPase Era involved in 16S rRNA processing|nr:dynamin family protein [Zoogloeaceae bacterium]